LLFLGTYLNIFLIIFEKSFLEFNPLRKYLSLVHLINIDFKYTGSQRNSNFALSNFNYVINAGEFISILGPNGSGKSTLIKLITGYLEPHKGRITLKGKNLNEFDRKDIAKIIAYVPQIPNSIYPFSIYEIVAMGRFPYLDFTGFEKESDKKIIKNVLDLMELSHLINKGINEVSGGEAQRAFIGRALVQEPKILLLDEPNSHLDIKHQISIFNLLRKLNRENDLTIVTVMHDLNLSSVYSSRVTLLKNGKIFLDGDVNHTLTPDVIKEVFEVNVKILANENNPRSIFINPDSNLE